MYAHELYRWFQGILALAAALAGAVMSAAQPQPGVVTYPDGFRSWQHVKSDLVGPEHASFPNRGGFHHFYANGTAIEGYRTGKFPNGSILVDEGIVAKNGEDKLKGIVLEGDRRSIDVMVKDDRLYKDTGGWGFEHFNGTDRTGTLSSVAKGKCFACHGTQVDRDSVFSAIRP